MLIPAWASAPNVVKHFIRPVQPRGNVRIFWLKASKETQMNKPFFSTITAIATLILVGAGTPMLCHAQMGGLMRRNKSASGGDNLIAQQEALVRKYVDAGNDILAANNYLLQALGLQVESVNMKAMADSLTAKDIEEQAKAISDQTQKIADGLKTFSKSMDENAKANYAKGLVNMVTGVKKYVDMKTEVQTFSSSLSSASPLEMQKLNAGAYVVKSYPTHVKNLSSALKNAIDFAKSNGIDIPKDATSLL
jgi:hypothetical protein